MYMVLDPCRAAPDAAQEVIRRARWVLAEVTVCGGKGTHGSDSIEFHHD